MQPDLLFATPEPDRPLCYVTGEQDGSVRSAFFGDLDTSTVPLLRTVILDVLRRQRPSRLELDLAGITFLDARGIRALLACRSDAAAVGCVFTLVRPRPFVRRILDVVGVLDEFGLSECAKSPTGAARGPRPLSRPL